MGTLVEVLSTLTLRIARANRYRSGVSAVTGTVIFPVTCSPLLTTCRRALSSTARSSLLPDQLINSPRIPRRSGELERAIDRLHHPPRTR